MFTGIIEEKGVLRAIETAQKSAKLTIEGNTVLKDTKIGDSIATNGVCLTVTDLKTGTFTVDVMFETLERSTLKQKRTGDTLNLERALTLKDRLGGHLMSGHVDGVGTLLNTHQEGIATVMTFEAPKDVMKYVANKGSIGIDGVSLTVIEAKDASFSVSVIPETKRATTLGDLRLRDTVNLEVDMIAKYVERLLKNDDEKETLDEGFLRRHGYL
ncbi:MAG: riboflavin synthase [Bacillota bacterium]